MVHYKIKIYKSAKQDLEDVIDDLNTLSHDIALQQYDEIIETINSLSELPLRCPYVRDTILRLKGYRRILVNNYIIFYVVQEDTVQVRRILYNKRNYQSFL